MMPGENMTINTSHSMALSQEELFVIMFYLRTETLPGFDLSIIKNLDQDQLNLIVGVAERALLARGFLKPDSEGRLQPELYIKLIIGTCTAPEKSLIITRICPKAPEEDYFFHTLSDVIVMHSIPITSMHQFIAVKDKKAITRTAISILSMDSLPKLKCTPGTVQQTVLENARDAAQNSGSKDALEILTHTDLTKETARQFAATLTRSVTNTTFAYFTKDKPIDGFTLLQGENGYWLLEPVEDSTNGMISVFPVSNRNIIQRIRSLLSN
jgi:hypothetical protein